MRLPSNGANNAPPPGSSSSNLSHSSSSISSSIPNDPEFYFSHLLLFTSDIRVRHSKACCPRQPEKLRLGCLETIMPTTKGTCSLYIWVLLHRPKRIIYINLRLYGKYRPFQRHNEGGNQKLNRFSALSRLCQNILFMLHSSEEGP